MSFVMLFLGVAIGLPGSALPLVCSAAPEPTVLVFDGDRALAHVSTQLDFGFRIPGTAAANATAAYIEEGITAAGFSASRQGFLGTSGEGQGVPFVNILGTKVAVNATNATPLLLLGAHWDTRPFTDVDSAGRTKADDYAHPVPGANDGASGVAVLLGLARAIQNRSYNVTIQLVFFDGEDYGHYERGGMFYGSRHYVQHLDAATKGRILGLILLDMIGDANLRIPKEPSSNRALTDAVWAAAKEANATAFEDRIGPQIIDDHTQFIAAGIAAVDVIDFDYGIGGTNYWHTPQDTLDKVSAASLAQVGRTMERYLEQYRAGSPPVDGKPPPGPVVPTPDRTRLIAASVILIVAGVLVVGFALSKGRRAERARSGRTTGQTSARATARIKGRRGR